MRQSFPYPGIPATADGSEAVVWVETHITQGACAYPITPSTNMGGGYQLAVANGQCNLWGEPLAFLELESEHSSASTCEGFALAGGRVGNFTSGQGLILMKEVLYVIAGKRLPVVFHIGARALTSQGLNIHAGHDDVMGVADCGWGMLFARNVQDVVDLALISRRIAEESETPFFNIQDGFLTTHTIESLRLPEPELMKRFVGDPNGEHRLRNLMDPAHPIMSGVVQNQDSYMKGKIAQRYFYDRISSIMRRVMEEFYALTGRCYGMIDAYALDDAEYVIVGMGSLVETATATARYLRKKEGLAVGTLHVTSFRPFPGPEIVEALKGAKAIAVLERMDNPAAQSNPLTAEIKAAFTDALSGAPGYPKIDQLPVIYSGSAGLGSRDIRPGDFLAVVNHMRAEKRQRFFVLGIQHELGLNADHEPDVRPKDAFSMRGHSVGGYGSVTTNKVIATIVGDLFGLQVQAYPMYGSEKKGLSTTYFLTVAEAPIRAHAELKHVDFVPLNSVNAFNLGNPLAGLVPGGSVFIQHPSRDPAQVWKSIPISARNFIRHNRVRVFALDAVKVAQEVASHAQLVQRMQGIVLLGVFLCVAPFVVDRGLSDAEVYAVVEKSLRKFFGKRGEKGRLTRIRLRKENNMYSRILIPLDGSTTAEQALPYARYLAKTLKIPVEVLAAVDPVSVTTSINAVPAGFLNSYIENCVRESGRYLDRISHTFPGLAITCSVEKGRPEEIIPGRAARDRGTLIIMATHGRSGLDRWLMGSVAEKVLRATANPLLLVRAVGDGKTTGEIGWKSVIVPLDGSELAESILPNVITLAREMKLEVMLARAYEIPATAYYGSEDYLPNYEALKEQIREEARDYLVNKTEGLKKAGVASVSWVLLDGPGADELIKLGRSTADNLIAMSTHGWSGVKRWVLGSVTEKIVRHSGDPVLVMPPKSLRRAEEQASERGEEFSHAFRCTLD